MSKYHTTIASAVSSANGRGLENYAATAASQLGYEPEVASTTNKFVQVRGAGGSALLAYYSRYGGFQIEVAKAQVVELIADLAEAGVLAIPAPGDSTGRRVALGSDVTVLGKALAVVVGEPVKAGKREGVVLRKAAQKVEEPKAVQAAPAAMIDATVDEDAEIAALEAAIAAKKAAKASKAAKIAALKAKLGAQ